MSDTSHVSETNDMSKRILGVVIARDEWPLLGLSITHAFNIGADHVVAVNHDSEDGTTEGLRRLQASRTGQLTVIDLKMQRFLQEATSQVVMGAVQASRYDWVYVFDADEFLLLPEDQTLSSLLNKVPPNVEAIRYEIHQWLAPHDMEETDLDRYGDITQRSLPGNFLELPGHALADELLLGNLNYFDLSFPSKLIVRGSHASRLTAGAHQVTGQPLVEHLPDSSILRCGHLPLTSRKRLTRKSAQGLGNIRNGFPPDHGWQNQALHRIEEAGLLDQYWQAHSITCESVMPAHHIETTFSKPALVTDTALSGALTKAVAMFRPDELPQAIQWDDTWTGPNQDLPSQNAAMHGEEPLTQNAINLGQVIEEFHEIKSTLSTQTSVHNTQIADQMQQIAALTQNLSDKDGQINALENQIERLSAQINDLLGSTSWRISAPLRHLVSMIRSALARRFRR